MRFACFDLGLDEELERYLKRTCYLKVNDCCFHFHRCWGVGSQVRGGKHCSHPLTALSPLSAVSLITNLLQVSVKRRFTVGKALGHSWLKVSFFAL